MSNTRHRVRYWLDSTLSRGTSANVMWLLVIAIITAVLMTLLILALTPTDVQGHRRSALATLWETFGKQFRLSLPHPSHPRDLLLQLLLGVTAVFFSAAVTAILATGLIGKLIQLRTGRSMVMESGHVVILGWSDQIFTIINELATAQAGRHKLIVTVMSEVEAAAMEAAIRQRVTQHKRLKVVCRNGVPIDEDDLSLMNLAQARSVIVLNPQHPTDADPDTTIVKTLLALSTQPGLSIPVVAAMHNSHNMEVARLAGGPLATVLDADDLIARLITHTARQPGVSTILTNLFDYAGVEIRLTRQPTLTGRAFGSVLTAFAAAIPIGLIRAGNTMLNPDHDLILANDDQLVVLTEDNSKLDLNPAGEAHVDTSAIVSGAPQQPAPTRYLVLGWNRRGPRILTDLAKHAAPGSTITVVGGEPGQYNVGEIQVSVHTGQSSDRHTLDRLAVEGYQQIIVLADDGPALAADARVISTLLHLRDIVGSRRNQCALVSEVRDDRDRRLIQATAVDDFIVSDHLISLLMAQLSEQSAVGGVFAKLLGDDGAKVYLRPAADLIELGTDVTFATVLASARRRGEIAIGYRRAQSTSTVTGSGAILNPPLSKEINLTGTDQVVVISVK